MTLRNRISVAAAVGVLIVVAAVSSVLYFSYAASLHSRVDADLIDAAQQASTLARQIKQAAASDAKTGRGSGHREAPDLTATVGSIQVQLFPAPGAGQPTRFGPLDSRDIAVAEGAQPAYFADARDNTGQRFRVSTAAGPNSSGNGVGLVRTSRAANADDGALRTAALLLAGRLPSRASPT